MSLEINERVVQIQAKGDTLFGLTESGKLARFDENESSWVLRANSNILGQSKEILTIMTIPTPRKMAISALNPPAPIKKKTDWRMVAFEVVKWTTLIALGAFLVWATVFELIQDLPKT